MLHLEDDILKDNYPTHIYLLKLLKAAGYLKGSSKGTCRGYVMAVMLLYFSGKFTKFQELFKILVTNTKNLGLKEIIDRINSLMNREQELIKILSKNEFREMKEIEEIEKQLGEFQNQRNQLNLTLLKTSDDLMTQLEVNLEILINGDKNDDLFENKNITGKILNTNIEYFFVRSFLEGVAVLQLLESPYQFLFENSKLVPQYSDEIKNLFNSPKGDDNVNTVMDYIGIYTHKEFDGYFSEIHTIAKKQAKNFVMILESFDHTIGLFYETPGKWYLVDANLSKIAEFTDDNFPESIASILYKIFGEKSIYLPLFTQIYMCAPSEDLVNTIKENATFKHVHENPEHKFRKNDDGFNLLYFAARYDKHHELVSLCDKSNANYTNKFGYSILLESVQSGHEKSIKILLENKANPQSCDPNHDESVLFCALKYNFLDCAELLLQHGANINEVIDNQSLLYCAVSKWSLEHVKLLLEYKADANEANVLLIPLNRNDLDCMELLLQFGMDPNQRFPLASTVLHFAAQQGLAKVAELFIKYQADINQAMDNGLTPLHLAAQSNQIECIKLLLKNGADITLEDDFGNTALDSAILHNNTESIVVMMQHLIDTKVLSSWQDILSNDMLDALLKIKNTEIKKLLLFEPALEKATIKRNKRTLLFGVVGGEEIKNQNKTKKLKK